MHYYRTSMREAAGLWGPGRKKKIHRKIFRILSAKTCILAPFRLSKWPSRGSNVPVSKSVTAPAPKTLGQQSLTLLSPVRTPLRGRVERTLPVRRAAADIALDAVDTRGVVGTEVVTAVVHVLLAVISVETCNRQHDRRLALWSICILLLTSEQHGRSSSSQNLSPPNAA